MTYLRLATKYRPKKFQHIVGQPDTGVVREIFKDLNSTPPLLLLCGPSGVGKTTLARVIAASVNCLARDPNGEPCGSCTSCSAAFTDSHPSVYEIDAASYGTADALRDIISRAHLYTEGINTFIIDEAQSISTQGWNVLLKTLEEPPENSLFIMLTSEPRKVPGKIRTRALSFNLKSIPASLIMKHLSLLVEKTGVNITLDDVRTISDACKGSLREAFMMVEQCAVSNKTAEELFANLDLSSEYFVALVQKDYTEALHVMDRWWDEVGDAKTILSQLSEFLERVILVKSDLETVLGSSLENRIKIISDILNIETIAGCLEQLSEWYPRVVIKAQLVLLTTKLYKVLNGTLVSAPVAPKAAELVPEPPALTSASLTDSLQGF